MSLSQRVRDFRYSKGWGPDELASRAAISRTALYQIESGKTELPRAGTLRRIAMALDVSMESLLGHAEGNNAPVPRSARPTTLGGPVVWARGGDDWLPVEGAPMSTPAPRNGGRYDGADNHRYPGDYATASGANFENLGSIRDRELLFKFQELMNSPFAEGLSRIVEEAHRLLPQKSASLPVTVAASVRGL